MLCDSLFFVFFFIFEVFGILHIEKNNGKEEGSDISKGKYIG